MSLPTPPRPPPPPPSPSSTTTTTTTISRPSSAPPDSTSHHTSVDHHRPTALSASLPIPPLPPSTFTHQPPVFVAGAFVSRPTPLPPRHTLASTARATAAPTRTGASVKINERALPKKDAPAPPPPQQQQVRRSNTGGGSSFGRKWNENMGLLRRFEVGAKSWSAGRPGGGFEDPRPMKFQRQSPPGSSSATTTTTPHQHHHQTPASAPTPVPAANASTTPVEEDEDPFMSVSMSEAEMRNHAALERLRQAQAAASLSHPTPHSSRMDLDDRTSEDDGPAYTLAPGHHHHHHQAPPSRPTSASAHSGERAGWDDETLRSKQLEVAALERRVEALRRHPTPVGPAPSTLPRPPTVPPSRGAVGRSNSTTRLSSSTPSLRPPPTHSRSTASQTPDGPRDYEEALVVISAMRDARARVEVRSQNLEAEVGRLKRELVEARAENRGLRHRTVTLEEDLKSLEGKVRRTNSLNAGQARGDEAAEREARRKAELVQALRQRPVPNGGGPSGVPRRARTTSVGGTTPRNPTYLRPTQTTGAPSQDQFPWIPKSLHRPPNAGPSSGPGRRSSFNGNGGGGGVRSGRAGYEDVMRGGTSRPSTSTGPDPMAGGAGW